jgi:hypothetical protein
MRWLLLLLWGIPLGFLLNGYWPFGVIPMTLLTLWLITQYHRSDSAQPKR